MKGSKQHWGPNNARGHTAAYDSTVTRAPRTKANWRDVECPSCGAAVKRQCINMGLRTSPADKGKPIRTPHPLRKRLAQRKWNEANL